MRFGSLCVCVCVCVCVIYVHTVKPEVFVAILLAFTQILQPGGHSYVLAFK